MTRFVKQKKFGEIGWGMGGRHTAARDTGCANGIIESTAEHKDVEEGDGGHRRMLGKKMWEAEWPEGRRLSSGAAQRYTRTGWCDTAVKAAGGNSVVGEGMAQAVGGRRRLDGWKGAIGVAVGRRKLALKKKKEARGGGAKETG